MALHRRVQADKSGAPSPLRAERAGGYWTNLPDVVSFLSALTWPDGSPRATGTVMLFAEGGCWKAWVHDRDAAMGMFASAGTLLDLMEVVDEAVREGTGDWRPDRKGGRK